MAGQQPQSLPPANEDMIACVNALDAALLPCFPNIELKALVPDFDEAPTMELHLTDDCHPPSHQTDVEKHARDFMEAAQKLQQYFICLRRPEDKPTKAETLRKEIAAMEEELKVKDELIQKQKKVFQEWKQDLKHESDKLNSELGRV